MGDAYVLGSHTTSSSYGQFLMAFLDIRGSLSIFCPGAGRSLNVHSYWHEVAFRVTGRFFPLGDLCPQLSPLNMLESWSHWIVLVDLRFVFISLQSPQCQDSRHVPPPPTFCSIIAMPRCSGWLYLCVSGTPRGCAYLSHFLFQVERWDRCLP